MPAVAIRSLAQIDHGLSTIYRRELSTNAMSLIVALSGGFVIFLFYVCYACSNRQP